MDPISIALSLAEITGFSGWLGKKINGEKGASVANKVLEVAKAVTGRDGEGALAVISADPKLQAEFKIKLAEQAHEIEKLEIQSALELTRNAQDMQKTALLQTDLFAKRFVYWFAWFWSLMACVYIGAITFGKIPETNIRFADTILGFILGTIVATILQFFYGTSHSSKGKDSTIHQAIDAVKSFVEKK